MQRVACSVRRQTLAKSSTRALCLNCRVTESLEHFFTNWNLTSGTDLSWASTQSNAVIILGCGIVALALLLTALIMCCYCCCKRGEEEEGKGAGDVELGGLGQWQQGSAPHQAAWGYADPSAPPAPPPGWSYDIQQQPRTAWG
jgi:hypothetical protein